MVCKKSRVCVIYVFLLKYLDELYDITQVSLNWLFNYVYLFRSINMYFLKYHCPVMTYKEKMILTQVLICCFDIILTVNWIGLDILFKSLWWHRHNSGKRYLQGTALSMGSSSRYLVGMLQGCGLHWHIWSWHWWEDGWP